MALPQTYKGEMMEKFDITKNCKLENKDILSSRSYGKNYVIAVESEDYNRIYLTPQDLAELAIACVLDVAKRHPAEYRAAAINAGVIEKRWVEKPGEEIKAGDWVKRITKNGLAYDRAYKVVKLDYAGNLILEEDENSLTFGLARYCVKVVQE